MKVESLSIPDVLVIRPKVWPDERGKFFEAFNAKAFAAAGLPTNFVQDNVSVSRKGVLRGLHYQVADVQGKLVTVMQGKIFDVAVDLRRSSPTFGQYVSVVISADEPAWVWIPEGFAHGFLALSEQAVVMYKVTAYYNPKAERTLRWDDKQVGISWPLDTQNLILSPKDQQGISLQDAEVFP